MNAADQFGAECGMHCTVPFDPAHRPKDRRADHDVEMRLAAFAPAPVTAMFFAVIDHFKRTRRESGTEAGMYFVCNAHFRQSAPSIPRRNP